MSTFPELAKIYPLPCPQGQLASRNRYSHTRPRKNRLYMCRLPKSVPIKFWVRVGRGYHVIAPLRVVSVICFFGSEFVECVNHVFADIGVPVSNCQWQFVWEETRSVLGLLRCAGWRDAVSRLWSFSVRGRCWPLRPNISLFTNPSVR